MAAWSIIYQRDFFPPRHMLMGVSSDGWCWLRLLNPPVGARLPRRSVIGTFRHQVEPDTTAALWDLLQNAARETPVEKATRPRSTHLLRVGWTVNEEPKGSLTVPLATLGAPLLAFDDRMQELAELVLDHPQRTLMASASWHHPQLAHGQDLALRLTLSNSGVEPMAIVNPAAAASDEQVGLGIILADDLPDEKITSDHKCSIVPRRDEVVQEQAPRSDPDAPPQAVVTLQPREQLILDVTVRRNLYLSPGIYKAVVDYLCPDLRVPRGEDTPGRLQARLNTFTVPAQNARSSP